MVGEREFLGFAADVFGVAPGALSLETAYGTIPQWDSMAQLRLVIAVKDRYGAEIPFADVTEVTSLWEFFRRVNGLSPKKAVAVDLDGTLWYGVAGEDGADAVRPNEALQAKLRELKSRGVVLGIENHDRFSAREYAQMIETVDHPMIGLTVDSVTSLSREETVAVVLEHMAPYCVCLHVKDYVIKRYNGGGGLKITGTCPGTGLLDIKHFYEVCREKSGRDFNVILESWMEPCGTLEETLETEDEWARAGVRLLNEMICG